MQVSVSPFAWSSSIAVVKVENLTGDNSIFFLQSELLVF